MKPQDHSDTTLLIWADWLEENGEEQKAHELREEIANPPAQRWRAEHYRDGIDVGGGTDNISYRVGNGAAGASVGGIAPRGVGGSTAGTVGAVMGIGSCVGGRSVVSALVGSSFIPPIYRPVRVALDEENTET